jgi:hypothetical protein
MGVRNRGSSWLGWTAAASLDPVRDERRNIVRGKNSLNVDAFPLDLFAVGSEMYCRAPSAVKSYVKAERNLPEKTAPVTEAYRMLTFCATVCEISRASSPKRADGS